MSHYIANDEPVYDSAARWWEILTVMLMAVLMAIPLLLLMGQKDPSLALSFSGFLAKVYAASFLYFYFMTSIWIRIDSTGKKVFRTYKLFGWTVFQKTYDLSQLNRITLRHKGLFYSAFMVGLGPEVLVAKTRTRDAIREKAEQVAMVSGLSVSEQL